MVSPRMSYGAFAVPPVKPGMPAVLTVARAAAAIARNHCPGRLAGREHRPQHVLHLRRGQLQEERRHRRDLAEVGERREAAHRLKSAEHARQVPRLPERRRVRRRGGAYSSVLHVLALVELVARVVIGAVPRPVVHAVVEKVEHLARDHRHEARLGVGTVGPVVVDEGLRQPCVIVVGLARGHAGGPDREEPGPRRDRHARRLPQLERIADHPGALRVGRSRLGRGELDALRLLPGAHARIVLLIRRQLAPSVHGHPGLPSPPARPRLRRCPAGRTAYQPRRGHGGGTTAGAGRILVLPAPSRAARPPTRSSAEPSGS